jgi:uncharacterized protein
MTPDLDILRRLQAHERDVAGAQARLAAMPARRDALAAGVDEARQKLEVLRAAAEDLQARRRKGDSEVSALQGTLTKYRDQLMTVTTGREYEAMQHEIATVESRMRALEDEVIGWLMEIDERLPQVAAAEQALAEAEHEAEQALADLAVEEQKVRLELAAYQGHVATERASLSAATLALYDRASKRYPLGAVAELKGDSCSACNVRLRPMVVSDIRRGERLVQCDSCTRVLFYVPPPAPPAPTPAPTV